MAFQFIVGKNTLRWTDARSKLILEVLGMPIHVLSGSVRRGRLIVCA